MILRTARRGRNSGGQFWGCSAYPSCTGTRDVGAANKEPSVGDAIPGSRNSEEGLGPGEVVSSGERTGHVGTG